MVNMSGEYEDPDMVTVRLFVRWHAMRKLRPDLVPALLQRPGTPWVWTFTNPMDPWGSRERLGYAELEEIVAAAELAVLERKPVGVEHGETLEAKRA
jgi:hypothetical protein